jgi:hypothetical protein
VLYQAVGYHRCLSFEQRHNNFSTIVVREQLLMV